MNYPLLIFENEFDKLVELDGIENPFKKRQNILREKYHHNEDGSITMDVEFDKDGKIIPDPREPSEEEFFAYIKMRERYVAEQTFYKIGYDRFLYLTRENDIHNNSDMRQSTQFVPCKSADRQCHLLCPQYQRCISGEWSPN